MILCGGVLVYWLIINHDGRVHALEIGSSFFFAILFGWIALSFSIATLGFIVALGELFRGSKAVHATPDLATSKQERTAVLMPVYNESPEAVFAGVKAMVDSLVDTGRADEFDFFILSDSNRYEVWLQEEELWRQNCQTEDGQGKAASCRIFLPTS